MIKKIIYILFLLFIIFLHLPCKENKIFNFELLVKNPINSIQAKDFHKNKLNFAFFIKKNICTKCVIASVNHYVSKIESLKLNGSTITILESDVDDANDQKVFKMKFKTSYFILDIENYIRNNFVSNDTILCTFFLIDSVGKILYKKNNFNIYPIEDFDLIVNSKAFAIKELKIIKSISLIENDSVIISNISIPYLNKPLNFIVFLDHTLNRILKYSTLNGNLIGYIDPPIEYKYYFANLNDSLENIAWTGFNISDDDFVSFNDLIISNNDTIVFVNLFNKAERKIIENEKNPTFVFSRGRYPFKLIDGKFIMLSNKNLTDDKDSIYLYKCISYSENELLCKYINYYIEDTIYSYYSKFPNQFVILNLNNWSKKLFMNYNKFNMDYNQQNYYPNIIYYATNANNYLIALDRFLKIGKLFNSDTLITELKSSEILTKFLNLEKKIKLLDIRLTKENILLIFSQSYNQVFNLIFEIYDFTGELIYQGVYESNDQLLKSYILDFKDGEIKLMNKWKNKRWLLQDYNIN